MHASVSAGVDAADGRYGANAAVKLQNVPFPGWWGLLGADTTASGDIGATVSGSQAGLVEAGGAVQAGPVLLSGRSRFRVQDVWDGIAAGMHKLMIRARQEEQGTPTPAPAQ
jgi:hypothetical protein